MILKTDCKHFPGDKPCYPNKVYGTICSDCEHYSPIKFKIVIIKFDAVGDVLRTTSLLHSVKKRYPDSHITWLTKKNASDIFINNKFVDELLFPENLEIIARLQTERFDLLIHPDASPVSAAYASLIQADVKRGFVLDKIGKVVPVNEDAVEWLVMGAFDQKKKVNNKTYQKIIHEIAGFDYEMGEIIIELTESEKMFRDSFKQFYNLHKYRKIIGLNTGAGSRWELKQWRFEGFVELISLLQEFPDIQILIYGGKEEIDRNKKLKELFPAIIDTGADNNLRQFFALVDISDIFITGDTMGLHAATALNKKVIAFFGPTSANEIEDYGRVIKLQPEMECLVCYKTRCDYKPNCMELISSETILREIQTLIS
jgi:heptosyltransferase-2